MRENRKMTIVRLADPWLMASLVSCLLYYISAWLILKWVISAGRLVLLDHTQDDTWFIGHLSGLLHQSYTSLYATLWCHKWSHYRDVMWRCDKHAPLCTPYKSIYVNMDTFCQAIYHLSRLPTLHLSQNSPPFPYCFHIQSIIFPTNYQLYSPFCDVWQMVSPIF